VKKPSLSNEFVFCFFIDGLDEYDAHPFEQRALALQLREWSINSGVKMCVSSRPEIGFLDAFLDTQRLHLHELNGQDICCFGRDMFEQDINFLRVKHLYKYLVGRIVTNAEGVFIWTSLVTKCLLIEVGRHASSERLWQALGDTPPEIDALYDQMLSDLSRRIKGGPTSSSSWYWPAHLSIQ